MIIGLASLLASWIILILIFGFELLDLGSKASGLLLPCNKNRNHSTKAQCRAHANDLIPFTKDFISMTHPCTRGACEHMRVCI